MFKTRKKKRELNTPGGLILFFAIINLDTTKQKSYCFTSRNKKKLEKLIKKFIFLFTFPLLNGIICLYDTIASFFSHNQKLLCSFVNI